MTMPDLNITTTTDTYKTTYTSDDSNMVTDATQLPSGQWVVHVNGTLNNDLFRTRTQAEDYAKMTLAVHMTWPL